MAAGRFAIFGTGVRPVVDETRGKLQTLDYGTPLGVPVPWRMASSAVAGAGVLAALLVTFRAQPLTALPGYPAVLLAFLLIVVLPGLIVQRAVLGSDAHPAVRLAVAPALGIAIMAVPGFIALEAHASLDDFAMMYAIVAAAACGLATLFAPDARPEPAHAPVPSRGVLLLAGLLLIALGGIATTPFWASNRLSADFDDWTYMAYVREYIDTEHMNESEPFLGTDEDVNPRMRDNVWVAMQALVSDATDVPPHKVLLEYLVPVLTIAAALATFALTFTLFRNLAIGLLAAAFQLGYGLIDLTSHEAFGRNLYLRISEDKMFAALVIFPVALLFLVRFLPGRSIAAYAGFALCVLAFGVVHPVPLVFLVITIACLAAIKLLADRDLRILVPMAALIVPVALVSVWPFIQRQLLVDAAPGLFSTEGSSITFRDEFHFVKLGFGLLVGNYHMILHPLVLLSIALTPLVWLAARRDLAHQLLAAMTAGALIAFFFPPFATPIAKVLTPQTLWKVPWMIPVAPVLAYATYQATQRLGRLRAFRPGAARLRSTALVALAPALLLVLTLGGALVVQEQYGDRDSGRFYTWRRDGSLLPWNDNSVFLGGIDRSFSSTWRIRGYQEGLFDYMASEIPEGSVVLAEPAVLNHMTPGILTDVYPVDFGGQAGEGQRREDVARFTNGDLSPDELDAVLERYDVSFIVTSESDPADQLVRSYAGAVWLEEILVYQVYQVAR